MGEIIAFANTHPVLASVVIALLVAVLAYEIRLKSRGLAQISTHMAVQLINRGALVIDVRPQEAYAQGHIANARHIPLEQITRDGDPVKKKKDKVLLAVCDSGASSRRAADALRKTGYESAYSLQGGMSAWRNDNLPVVR